MSERMSRRDDSQKSDPRRLTAVHPSRSPSQESWSASDAESQSSSKMSLDEAVHSRHSPSSEATMHVKRRHSASISGQEKLKKPRPKSNPESEEYRVQPSSHVGRKRHSSGGQHRPLTTIPSLGADPLITADPCIIEPPPTYPQLFEPVKPGQTQSSVSYLIPTETIVNTGAPNDVIEEVADIVVSEDPVQPNEPTAVQIEAVVTDRAVETRIASLQPVPSSNVTTICVAVLSFGVMLIILMYLWLTCILTPMCGSNRNETGNGRNNPPDPYRHARHMHM